MAIVAPIEFACHVFDRPCTRTPARDVHLPFDLGKQLSAFITAKCDECRSSVMHTGTFIVRR
jgi:hypothetical protein